MNPRAQVARDAGERMRVALIGAGNIARIIASYARSSPSFEIAAVLTRAPDRDAAHWPHDLLVQTRDAMLDRKPQLVVECASHSAVYEHVVPVLQAGIDIVVASSGAFADPALLARASSVQSCAQLIIPAGALPGIDGLAAAARDSLAEVRLISTKPPPGWSGTPGAEVAMAATQRCVLFRGDAREAARLYPRNANVAATIALAGIGFERTEVTLVAEPAATGNSHRVEARGRFGRFTVDIEGSTSEANPRTSRLTAYSIIRAIETRLAVMVL